MKDIQEKTQYNEKNKLLSKYFTKYYLFQKSLQLIILLVLCSVLVSISELKFHFDTGIT